MGVFGARRSCSKECGNFKHDYANLVNLIQKTIHDALTAELPNIRTEPAMNAEPGNESIVEEFLALF